MKKFDVVIIGAGPGGYTAALRIAQLGGKACIVEKRQIGGVCANTGCIPTKAYLSTAKLLSDLKNSERLGVTVGNISCNIEKVKVQAKRVVRKTVTGMERLLAGNGVVVLKGFARIAGCGKVVVYDDERKEKTSHTLNAKNIIIATGSRPIIPRIVSCDDKALLTNEDIFALDVLPKSLAIIGGGCIGLEFACIFNSLGAKVYVIEKLGRILAAEDEEISKEASRIMRKAGISILANTEIKSVQKKEGLFRIKAIAKDSSADSIELRVEKLLLAAGREPNFNEQELENLGIVYAQDGIKTDSFMRTNVKNIYAIGDVNGKFLLAGVAISEGIVAAENIMGEGSGMDYSSVPNCIFTIPEIASVGKREGKVGKFPFIANGKASTMGERDGFVKVYVNDGKLVGASIIGPQASTLIAAAQALLGKAPQEIKKMVAAHPTLPEAIFEAILDAEGQARNLFKK